jgi:hypothetical protein
MREPERPSIPCALIGAVTVSTVRHSDIWSRFKCVAPIGKTAVRKGRMPLCVTFPHQPECVFVETHPQVEPMFFDAVGDPSPRRALSTQPPAHLINGDLIPAHVLRAAQLESCGKRGTAAADHGDADRRAGIRHPDAPNLVIGLGIFFSKRSNWQAGRRLPGAW